MDFLIKHYQFTKAAVEMMMKTMAQSACAADFLIPLNYGSRL